MHEPFIDTDETGCLFDRRVREHVNRDVPPDEIAASEALAALRLASHGFRTMMDRWLERHDMSEGRLGVLWRLRHKGPMTLGDYLGHMVKHMEHHLKFIHAKRAAMGKEMW